jgi:hypothetical protein
MMIPNDWAFSTTRSFPKEGGSLIRRKVIVATLAVVIASGCAGVQRVEEVEGPFEIALMATTDTRGELEPCG